MAEKTPSMDADSTSLITNTSPNVNVVLSSNNKPVRFGSFKNHIHSAGKESPVLNSTDLNKQLPTMTTPLPSQKEQQVSISVPSVVAATSDESKVAPNVNNSTNVGANSGSGCAGLGQNYISCNVTPPNSASIRQTAPIALETKLLRRTSSLRILMPKLSADNISYSPGSTFSGLANWSIDNREKSDGNQTDKSATEISKLNRKESYKAQRKNYRREKKRVASELLNSLQDPAVIVLADWLKVRGTLKSWTKLWCVLKPGLLLLYKSPKTKSSHWVGTILLTSCHVIERPSKKDGFCFKLFHPLEQSIWAPRGPDKETIGAVVQPLPTAYLIFRAPSQAAGKCWMDALELSLRCSGLLLRSNSTTGNAQLACGTEGSISHETQWSEADYEKHFNDQDLDGDSQNEAVAGTLSGVDTDSESDINDGPIGDNQMELIDDEEPLETPYVLAVEGEFNTESGEQVEELGEENKSLIWCLVKQVRPGMDLSKVVLPTFILEPRSFLDKLSDSYYHVDILSKVVNEDDPLTRMKLVVHWYLSGFYKKPKGLKKPYNPILGETFRCYWQHPTGSRTYYIAEQVSHHPPVTAFYVTNRQEGFSISCSILAKSKFYGNSTSAVLDGEATLTILPRGESYTLNTPYAHCKGILMGTLSMELGGKVNIDCENTGYKTELEFKLRPFLGGVDQTNVIVGKIKLIKETLATIHGRWDNEIRIKDSKTGEETVLFVVNKDTIKSRLKRYVVPIDSQLPNESERLWHLVSEAIRRDDQVGATEEKTILEDGQRNAAKERKTRFTEWEPAHFQQDILTGKWVYKYADLRPWDPRNDVKQYEIDYQVLTKTRHLAPTVRTASIVNVNAIPIKRTTDRAQSAINILKNTRIQTPTIVDDSDSSRSQDNIPSDAMDMSKKSVHTLILAVEQVNKALDEHTRQLMVINAKLERMHFSVAPRLSTSPPSSRTIVQTAVAQVITESVLLRTVACVIVALIATYFLKWLLN